MNKIIGIILTFLILGVIYMATVKEGSEENFNKDNDVAIITTKFGQMIVEFYPELAPMHVESFVTHANEGYFDGTTFHRIIPGFVIQGGDPNSRSSNRATHGTGGRAGKFFGIGDEEDPNTWLIPAEFNSTPHTKGILSMARTNDPNSASSQFFICHDNAPFLDNNYTVFGKVIDGAEFIDLIVNQEKDMRDNPIEKVEMTIKMSKRSELLID